MKTFTAVLLTICSICLSQPYFPPPTTTMWACHSTGDATPQAISTIPTVLATDAGDQFTEVIAAAAAGDLIFVYGANSDPAGDHDFTQSQTFIGVGANASMIGTEAGAGSALKVNASASGDTIRFENLLLSRQNATSLGRVINRGLTSTLTPTIELVNCTVGEATLTNMDALIESNQDKTKWYFKDTAIIGSTDHEEAINIRGSNIYVDNLSVETLCDDDAATVVQSEFVSTAGRCFIKDSSFIYDDTATVTTNHTVVKTTSNGAIFENCLFYYRNAANKTGEVYSVLVDGIATFINCTFYADTAGTDYHLKLNDADVEVTLINCNINTSMIENTAAGTVNYIKTAADANGRVDVSLVNGAAPLTKSDVRSSIYK